MCGPDYEVVLFLILVIIQSHSSGKVKVTESQVSPHWINNKDFVSEDQALRSKSP